MVDKKIKAAGPLRHSFFPTCYNNGSKFFLKTQLKNLLQLHQRQQQKLLLAVMYCLTLKSEL